MIGLYQYAERLRYHLHDGFLHKVAAQLGQVTTWDTRTPIAYVFDQIRDLRPDLMLWSQAPDVPFPDDLIKKGKHVLYWCDAHWANTGSADQARSWVDLIITRSLAGLHKLESLQLPAVYIPFSVDEASIPTPTARPRDRVPLVSFAGATDASLYPNRTRAIEALAAAQLLDNRQRPSTERGMTHLDYMRFLSEHPITLTCSCSFRVLHAKHLETLAAGSALLSDGRALEMAAMPDLIPENLYLTYTPETVVDIVRRALNDPDRLDDLAQRGQAHVLAHHTDAIRTREVAALLRAQL